jgi:F0F1-type ATP synthase epsilon subunit
VNSVSCPAIPLYDQSEARSVRYVDKGARNAFVFVSGGFAEALPDRVTILADSAERRKDIDLERAKAAKARAEERLASEDKENVDFVRARLALQRAILRIRMAEATTRLIHCRNLLKKRATIDGLPFFIIIYKIRISKL